MDQMEWTTMDNNGQPMDNLWTKHGRMDKGRNIIVYEFMLCPKLCP